jgi:hypothetical protein
MAGPMPCRFRFSFKIQSPRTFWPPTNSIIEQAVLRSFLTSLLCGLTIATLLCGGCVSCPQFFMVPGVKKDCCQSGHCQNPKSGKNAPRKECNRMGLDRHGFVHLDVQMPEVAFASDDFAPLIVTSAAPLLLPERVEHPPPDVHLLNATFLI